ncbi:5820_t:CDS:1, partial [Gigaspora margarita]
DKNTRILNSLIDSTNKSTRAPTASTTKGLAKAIDSVYDELNNIKRAFEEHQENMSIKDSTYQKLFNDLNTKIDMNYLDIKEKINEFNNNQRNILDILEVIRDIRDE